MKRMLATLLALAMVLTMVGVPAFAAEVTVEPGASIQAAIDTAANGDTIKLKAGIYQQQLIISGKQINIVGEEGTVIAGPADYTTMQSASAAGRSLSGIINVQDDAAVSISNVEVKGNPALATAAQNITHTTTYTGIAVVNASADISGAKITDITYEGSMQGMQNGIGLYALADAGEHTVSLTGSEITNFNKGAVVLRGMGNLTATVTGNTITGYGEQGVISQNGIQTGVESTVKNNNIRGLIYAPDPTNDWAHGSVAVYFADGYAYDAEKHSPNTVTDVDMPLYSYNIVEDGWSIQDAIDEAKDGDTITVKAGTYTESLNLNKAVTLKAEGDVKPVIEGRIAVSKSATIDGFDIQYASADNTIDNRGVISVQGDGITANIKNGKVTQKTSGNTGVLIGFADTSYTNMVVNLDNVIVRADSGQAVRVANHGAKLNVLNDSALTSCEDGKNAGFGIIITGRDQVVTVDRSGVIGKYGIQFQEESGSKLEVRNGSHIEGYAALYNYNAQNATILVDGSTLESTRINGESNSFSTVCDGQDAQGTNLTITNSTLIANDTTGDTSVQGCIDLRPASAVAAISGTYFKLVSSNAVPMLYAIQSDADAVVNAKNNYWGASPDFENLLEGTGQIDVYPYYADEEMTTLVWGSLQNRIDAAQPGDVIEIPAGTYTESLVFNRDYKGITLKPEGEAKSVTIEASQDPANWAASSALRFEAGAKNITIDGLVLRGADTNQANQEPATVLFGTDVENVTIKNSTISANGEAAISNIYGAVNKNIVIEGNLIDGKTFAGNTVANVPKFTGDYQFQYLNVPRPAVQFNSCTGDIIFTNNTVETVTGGLRAADTEQIDGFPLDASLAGTPLYNSIITIDTKSPYFEGNTIVLPEGYTNATDMVRFRQADTLANGKSYNLGDNTYTWNGFEEGVILQTGKAAVLKDGLALPNKTTVVSDGSYNYYYYKAAIEAPDAVDAYLILDVSNDGAYLAQDATQIDAEEGVVYADVDGDDTAGNSYQKFTIGTNVFEVGAAKEDGGVATFNEAIEAINAAAEVAAANGKTLTVYLKSGVYAADNAVIDQNVTLKKGSEPIITGTITINSEISVEGVTFQNGTLTISVPGVVVKDAEFVGVEVVVEEAAEGTKLENVSFVPDTTKPEEPVNSSLSISAPNTTIIGKDDVEDPTQKNQTFGAGTVVEVKNGGKTGLVVSQVVVDTSEPEAEGISLPKVVVNELLTNNSSDIIYSPPEAEEQAQISLYFGDAAAYEKGTSGLTSAYTVPVYAKGFTEGKQFINADITLLSEDVTGNVEIAGAVNLDADSALKAPKIVKSDKTKVQVTVEVDSEKATSVAPDENGAVKLFDLIVSGNGASILIEADTGLSKINTTKYLPDDNSVQEALVILSGQKGVEIPKKSKPNVPEASVKSGTYSNSFYVTLTTDPEDSGDEIYYTTVNGAKPDKLYTGRILISRTTKLTVMAVNSDGIESATKTFTYSIQSNSSNPNTNPGNRPNPGTPGVVYPAVHAHTAYMSGYPDSTVKPDAQISREELASIIYRVMGDNIAFTPQGNVYSDVAADRWSAAAIEYLSQQGILSGYPDGTFAPEQSITRAEFAKVIAVWRGLAANGQTYFVDIANTWATDYINAAAAAGYMQGESAGIFAPERSITRAEVATAVNRILERRVTKDTAAKKGNPFTDLSQDHWAFAEILEASVQHNYVDGSDGYENWR